MPPTGGTTGELQDLQRSLRDLVALSTLPAVWAKTSPTNIVGSLAEVLHRALSLDFVYVHAHREEGAATLEAVRTNPTRIPDQTAQSFAQTLSPWLKSEALGVHSISNPCGSGAVRMIVLSLGHGAHGFVAAGSGRPDFPTETEQLLLRVGANQAEIVLERRWADEALRESQQRLQATYYCAPVGIAETSPEGKFVKVNEELCRTLGYNQDELLQRSIEEVTHAEDCSLDIDLHRQLIASEIPSYQIEKRFVRKDGSIVWTEIRRSAVRDAEGVLLYTIGAVRDITARKRLEESQRENEERQAFLLRLTDALRPLGDPLDTQEVAARLLGEHLQVNRVGYAEIDARGYVIQREYARGVRPLVGQGPAGSFGAALRDAYKSGETVVVNDVGTDPRFTEAERAIMQARQIAAYVGVTLIKDGRLVAAFGANNATPRVWTSKEVELISDVAERTWEAVERARAETAVRESEQRLRLALEASGAGSWMRDLRTNRADWDGRSREIYGITAGEPTSFEAWLGHVHEEDRRQVLELWDRIRHTKTHDTFDYTFRIVRPDGTVLWIQSLGQAHRDANGQVIRLTGIELDITERKRMEEERAAEGRRKDEFLSMLGHELRNPLATISTAVQLLSGGLTDEERVSLNGMMDRQVKLMGRLLDDLLDLGRMTHGHIQLRKERIDLAKLLQHVTEVTQSTAAERGQELTLRLPSEIVTFDADEARLQQIMINLLSNASKYTPQGGRIEFSGAREGSEVVIRCKDNGRGIPPEMQQKIFEPFTRVAPFSDSRGEASLGIGLALVKRLVELHGGTITVESGGPGMGSEFVVRLPLESAPSDQAAAPEAKPAPTSGLSRSIVLVEDNSDVAGTMVIFLEKAGYRVTLFADAFSALAGLSDLKPHAILLDIGLPGMDGYKLAAKLKEKPHLQHTLFIGLSGFKRREATKSIDDFDHYFNKPVDLPALLAVLDTPAPLRKGRAATERTVANDVKTQRVLLIDDHAELAAATAALLRSEGLEVRTALSGRDSLQAALDFKPELTFCDLNLPDMQGPEVIRLLRSNPLIPPTYAVVLTAMSNQEIRDLNREAKRMGIDEFIPKPLTIEAVRRLVTKLKRQQSA